VADSSNFYLSREIEIAGNSFSKLFLTEENSFEEAEIAKKTYQFEIDAEEEEEIIDLDLLMTGVEDNSSVQTGIKNLLANLINELNRSIDYHNERNKENLINNIYLTGGGLLLKGLVEYLQAEIDLPVAALDPWLKFNNTESAEVNKTMIAIAAGTVLSEVEYHAG
jgi:type IV pilus assembly protein PilM